jgi:hypothetical protein
MKTHRLPLVVQYDMSKLYAVAHSHMPFQPTELWLNGERTEIKHDAVNPGQRIMVPIPGGTKEQIAAAQVAFFGKLLGNDQSTSVPIAATVQGEKKSGSLLIDTGSEHTISVDPELFGHVSGLELKVHALCGTCRGIGLVGWAHHQVTCPVCKGGEYREHNVTELFIEDVLIGMRSSNMNGMSVPYRVYEDRKLRLDTMMPGQFITLRARNQDTRPVMLSGAVIFQEEEIPEPPARAFPSDLLRGDPLTQRQTHDVLKVGWRCSVCKIPLGGAFGTGIRPCPDHPANRPEPIPDPEN